MQGPLLSPKAGNGSSQKQAKVESMDDGSACLKLEEIPVCTCSKGAGCWRQSKKSSSERLDGIAVENKWAAGLRLWLLEASICVGVGSGSVQAIGSGCDGIERHMMTTVFVGDKTARGSFRKYPQ